MTTADAKKILEANIDRSAVFVSDPRDGDQIIITNELVLPPSHVEGTYREDVARLLIDLDFEIYDGNGPEVIVKPT